MLEERVHVERYQRLRSTIICRSVEAQFLHQELSRYFPWRRSDIFLEPRKSQVADTSLLRIESDAPLTLQQRQFLTSCGLSISDVELL